MQLSPQLAAVQMIREAKRHAVYCNTPNTYNEKKLLLIFMFSFHISLQAKKNEIILGHIELASRSGRPDLSILSLAFELKTGVSLEGIIRVEW